MLGDARRVEGLRQMTTKARLGYLMRGSALLFCFVLCCGDHMVEVKAPVAGAKVPHEARFISARFSTPLGPVEPRKSLHRALIHCFNLPRFVEASPVVHLLTTLVSIFLVTHAVLPPYDRLIVPVHLPVPALAPRVRRRASPSDGDGRRYSTP